MFPALALGALSFGGSLLSGIGAKQASAKQGRMQMIADGLAREANERQLAVVNEARERLGREMLTVPEETERGGWVDVDGFMAAAERSGFNPVTFLNAGGLSAYSQTWQRTTGHNAEAAYKLMVPDYALSQASQVPQQHSMLSAFGGALTAGVNTFGTQYRADQSYDLQMARLLQGTVNQGMGLSQSNGLTTALSFGGGTTPGLRRASESAGGVSALPYPQSWERGKVEVTNPSGKWYIDPTVADAEPYETRYGDLAQELFGASNLFQDMVRTTTGKTLREWGVISGMNIGDFTTPKDNSYLGTISRWWNSPSTLPNRKLPGFDGGVTPYMPFPGANAY